MISMKPKVFSISPFIHICCHLLIPEILVGELSTMLEVMLALPLLELV